MNFAHFYEFWCFSLGKQARFTLNFCSGMPLRKVHEPTFLWFGLPGPLLNRGEGGRKLFSVGGSSREVLPSPLFLPPPPPWRSWGVCLVPRVGVVLQVKLSSGRCRPLPLYRNYAYTNRGLARHSRSYGIPFGQRTRTWMRGTKFERR